MGTWGAGLYSSDTTADLRDDFRAVVRAPWDGDRLVAWALSAYTGAADPADEEFTDLRLALADQLWTYGIDHSPTFEAALRIVDDGSDLATKRLHGMRDRDLARRAKALDLLAQKLRSANPKPRSRRTLSAPEPFALEAGDCLVYPTSGGEVRNPYVGPRKEERFYAVHRWAADGWASAIVLACYRKHDVFARYLVALLRSDPERPPKPEEFAAFSILHTTKFGASPRRRVEAVTTTRLHLERMRVEIVGRLAIDAVKVATEFASDRPPISKHGDDRNFANDAWIDPPGREVLQFDDPVGRYLI